MKKLALVIGLALIASSNLFAQEFGLKAGINLNRIDGNEFSESYTYGESRFDFTTTIGVSAGVSFEYAFSDNLGLATGLNFTQKGTGIEISDSYEYSSGENFYSESEKYVMKLNTNYAEIPVMLKAGFMAGNVKLYGLVGGSFGVAMFGKASAESTYEYTETYGGETYSGSASESESENLEYGINGDEMMNRFNFGFVPGVGVELGNFQVEATYNMGINKMMDDDYFGGRGNTLNFSVGYKFGKK